MYIVDFCQKNEQEFEEFDQRKTFRGKALNKNKIKTLKLDSVDASLFLSLKNLAQFISTLYIVYPRDILKSALVAYDILNFDIPNPFRQSCIPHPSKNL